MTKICCVCGLVSIPKVTKQSFYFFPKITPNHNPYDKPLTEERLAVWRRVVPINFRKGKKPPMICSDHFQSGKPAYQYMTRDVDWVPTINMEINNTMGEKNHQSSSHCDSGLDTAITPQQDHDMDISRVTPDFISPDLPLIDDPLSLCSSKKCFKEKNRLRSQLQEKIKAHNVTKTELKAVQRELDDAKEQLALLRAQLEENTHALCAYFSTGSSNIIVKTEKH